MLQASAVAKCVDARPMTDLKASDSVLQLLTVFGEQLCVFTGGDETLHETHSVEVFHDVVNTLQLARGGLAVR